MRALSALMFWSCTKLHTRLTALFPGLPRWAGTRKAKPIWILLKQETVSGSGISWAKCKSAPCSRQTTTPAPHHSVFYTPDALPAAQPTASKDWKRERSLFNMSEHNKYIYKLDIGRLPERNNHHSWPPIRQNYYWLKYVACYVVSGFVAVTFSVKFVEWWVPSVLWRCWLGGRKGIQPVKLSVGVLVWLSVSSKTCIWPSWCHCHSLSLASVKSRGPIYKISYDNLTIMPKLRSTYDGRLIYKTSYEELKAFLRHDSPAKL